MSFDLLFSASILLAMSSRTCFAQTDITSISSVSWDISSTSTPLVMMSSSKLSSDTVPTSSFSSDIISNSTPPTDIMSSSTAVPDILWTSHATSDIMTISTVAPDIMWTSTASSDTIASTSTAALDIDPTSTVAPDITLALSTTSDIESTSTATLDIDQTSAVAPDIVWTSTATLDIASTSTATLNIDSTSAVAPDIVWTSSSTSDMMTSSTVAPDIELTSTVASGIDLTTSFALHIAQTSTFSPDIELTSKAASNIVLTSAVAPNNESISTFTPDVRSTTTATSDFDLSSSDSSYIVSLSTITVDIVSKSSAAPDIVSTTTATPDIVSPTTITVDMIFKSTAASDIVPSSTVMSAVPTTTETPGATTEPYDATTGPPDTTTGPPDTTTRPSDTTTRPPSITNGLLGNITGPTDTTTELPDITAGPTTTTTTTTGPTKVTTRPQDNTTPPQVITSGLPDITTGPTDNTTGIPDITAGPADTTTGPPKTTTGAPDFTTGLIDTKTGPPVTTTRPPAVPATMEANTTTPLDITTGPRDTTPGPPDVTTAPTDTSTGQLDITTGPTDAATASPDITNPLPDSKTGPPDTTAGPPGMTTGLPETTPQPPGITNSPTDFTNGPPVITTGLPGITTEPPDTTGPPGVTTGPRGAISGIPGIMTGPQGIINEHINTTTGPPGITSGPPDITNRPPVTATALSDITTEPPGITTGAPETTSGPLGITSGPPDTTTGSLDITTGILDTTTEQQDTTTVPVEITKPTSTTPEINPLPTTALPCDRIRREPTQEDINNSFVVVTQGLSIPQWCFSEDLFRQRLAEYVAEFCINSGSCPIIPPPDPKIVQIAPGFPVQNTPLKVRLYINLGAGVNSSSGTTTLTLSKVETFLDAFVQNASATLGVQVSVDGGFTEWSQYGQCSSSCGTGTQIRTRTCTNPPPVNNGSDCQGPRNETQNCTSGSCPEVQASLTFFEQDCLDRHNSRRFQHGTGALVWDEAIASGARNWSQFLLQNQSLLHDTTHSFGENLGFLVIPAQNICNSAAETSCVRCSQIVDQWYNEISNYNFNDGTPNDPSLPYLHFTQVVWRSSSKLGMGVASGGNSHYFVARYDPGGNVGGRFVREVPRIQLTVAPTTTPTAPPDTTTGPPETTTNPPEITTAPLDIVTSPPDTTTGPAEITTNPPENTTSPVDITTSPPDTATAPPDTTTTSPDITTGPLVTTPSPSETTTNPPELTTASPDTSTVPPDITTSPPEVTTGPCNRTRRRPLPEDESNSISMEIVGFNIPQWCQNEDQYKKSFSAFVDDYCRRRSGTCGVPQVLNASEVFLQPGYPVAMSPIRIKVYVRLPAGGDTSVSLERRLLANVLQPLVQNITNTFGVQISVDGNFTEWGVWGQCSSSCGPGTQVRTRTCTSPPPINNGSDCTGPKFETQPCNDFPCPTIEPTTDASSIGVPTTGPPSSDSPTTGPPATGPPTTGPPTTGIPTTSQPCVFPTRRPVSQEEVNNAISLIIRNINLQQWCVREGAFKQQLVRFVIDVCSRNASQCGNISAPPADEVLINIVPGFPIQFNPVEVRFYVRLKTGMNASQTLDREIVTVILQSSLQNASDTLGIQITVAGNFSEWSDWGPCSSSCGIGTQNRTRTCTNPPPINNGSDCEGFRVEERLCNGSSCPVDGNYTEWTPWGQCSTTCDNGTQTRYRSCINPAPLNGGRDCQGPRNETQLCIIEACTPRLYPYGVQFNDIRLPNSPSLTSFCFRINIDGQGIPFVLRRHRRIYACRNGMLKFISSRVIQWPERFPGRRNEDGIQRFRSSFILAPYWAVISHAAFGNQPASSKVFYQVYKKHPMNSNNDKKVFKRANRDVQRYQTNPTIPLFEASWILVVTWVNIYPSGFPLVQTANTFQAVLISDGYHTFTLFNYPENGIKWSTPSPGIFRPVWQNVAGLPVAGYNAGVGFNSPSLRYVNLPRSGTVDVDTLDALPGTATNLLGRWFYRLDENSPFQDLSSRTCAVWIRQQFNVQRPLNLPACPCQFNQATLDKRFFVDYNGTLATRNNGTICAYSIPSVTSRWSQQCCYTDIPGGGKVLSLGPPEGGSPLLIPFTGAPGLSDFEGRDACCNTSSLCSFYYRLRPSRNCLDYFLRRRGFIFGDPHFTTLDNTTYTFNGLGEYTMIVIDNGVFEMQARTRRTTGRGLGTVFSTAAAKEENTAIVEGRIDNKGGLEVLVAGRPYDISSIAQFGARLPEANITLIRDSDGSVTALFPSGISFIFANVERALSISFDGPVEFKNRTRGLLGTWNDDPSDDFVTPDGKMLPAEASPQEIHYKFGLKWQIDASKSLFTYGANESSAAFIDLSYVPMFIDNITWTNDSFRLQAERVCGNNTNCLFDAAVTVDTSYGWTTRRQEENNNQVNRELASFPPRIHGPNVINATINQTIELNITAEHNSSDYFVFTVWNFPNVEIVANTSQYLVIRWQPISTQTVEPVFDVTGSDGSSSELRPMIVLCPCKHPSRCIEDEVVQIQRESGARFIILSCGCPSGFTGQFCKSKIDACVENNQPCFPGVKCHDLNSSGGKAGYRCDPCPAGYRGDGAICEDIDECASNVSKCSQLCINSPGSYLCDCNHGYQLDNDHTSCKDINECMDFNDCMHNCSNFPGGRNCTCFEGFQVDPNENTVCIPILSCNATATGCQQVCAMVHGLPKCSCHKGYDLDNDGKSCHDINECTTHKHKCSQLCHNSDGSYKCSCRPGFTLSSDGVTCNDIDECGLIDELYCAGPLDVCFNTIGSFRCDCQQGFQRVNSTCEENFPEIKARFQTSAPTFSVQTDLVPKDGINNAVAMTLKDTNLEEWRGGLSISFKDAVTRVAVAYCEQGKDAECYNTAVVKRSVSGETLTGSVELLKKFPKEQRSYLVVAFYVILQNSQGEGYVMNQNALVDALKESVAVLSSSIKKEVYNIQAYLKEDRISPPSRESQIDKLQNKWIIIGVSATIAFVMVMVMIALFRRNRENSYHPTKLVTNIEFFTLRWNRDGTREDDMFLGIPNPGITSTTTTL